MPELHALTAAAGFHSTIALKWELRKRLEAPHGNCVENDKQVNATVKIDLRQIRLSKYQIIWVKVASIEPANWSILAAYNLFQEVVEENQDFM